MHIKQLELFGFKSFVDKTTITFSTGISAVVGPNGCGKSNIVDAIRWVLGEQSAKQLRGKLMEEIIFSGANGRPSLNFTEVSLIISVEDSGAPPPYHECSEIMITRRLFRSGDSEYFINKIPCRRLDIARLFLDTGFGHRHYAIIEQGKIGNVLESKPDDIRALIEEAAGITKFKLKKKAALRKIELTEQNLLRLGDIVAEVSRQLTSLKRQAQRASGYQRLKKEIKHLEVCRALRHYQQWQEEVELLEVELGSLEDVQAKRRAHLARVDGELAEVGSELDRLEERLQQDRQSLFSLKNAISRAENSGQHLRRQIQQLQERDERLAQEIHHQEQRQRQFGQEKARLEAEQRQLTEECSRVEKVASKANERLRQAKARFSELTAELDSCKADLVDLLGGAAQRRNQDQSLKRRCQELRRRRQRRKLEAAELHQSLARLRSQAQQLEEQTGSCLAEVEHLQSQADSMRQRKAGLEKARSHCQRIITRLESSYHQQQSQLRVLEEMEKSRAWFNDAVRSLMDPAAKGELHCNVRGIVAEMLEVKDPGHRRAVEAVLGGRLQALVVDSLPDACSAVEHLKRTRSGRNHFIPLTAVEEKIRPAGSPAGPLPLAALVKVRPGFELVLDHLLSGVLYFADLAEALEWWQSNPHTHTLVTAEGELLTRDGILWGGSRDDQGTILEKRQEAKRLGARVEALDKALQLKRRRLREFEAGLAQVNSQQQATEDKQQELRDQLLQLEKGHYRLEGEQQKVADRLALLDMEKDQDHAELSQLEAGCSANRQKLLELEKRQQELEENLAASQSQRQELERQLDGLQEEATARQVSLGALAEKRRAARASHQRLADYCAEAQEHLRQLQQQKRSCQEQLAQLDAEKRETTRSLEQKQRELREWQSSLQKAEERWQQLHGRQRDLEARRVRLLQEDKEQDQESHHLAQQVAELKLKSEYLLQQIRERYHLDLRNIGQPEAEESLDLTRLEEKLQGLRERLARIGEVNLTAIQEYEEQRQRHSFLTTQRDDLLQSLEGLKKAITRINRTTRRRFLTTLDAVNRKLEEVFPLLFEGGSARLRLTTQHGDPLEAGVEILVHPPGKRLTSMSLLSGGEKALAAVALLFTLYMIRPSPFCILDEVDAPLDEANIDRFNLVLETISQESQIIMVTHNKRTMEISDLLLGVTMEEPGVSRIISVNFQRQPDSHGQVV